MLKPINLLLQSHTIFGKFRLYNLVQDLWEFRAPVPHNSGSQLRSYRSQHCLDLLTTSFTENIRLTTSGTQLYIQSLPIYCLLLNKIATFNVYSSARGAQLANTSINIQQLGQFSSCYILQYLLCGGMHAYLQLVKQN